MTDQKKEAPSLGTQVASGALIGPIVGLLTAAAGAGWPGVVAMGLLGVGLPFLWSQVVGMFNRWADGRDLNRAGSDAGNTAVEIKNQGQDVRQGLDDLQSGSPPSDGTSRQ